MFVYLQFTDRGTIYQCECSQCWNTVAATESLDWITVSLMECPLRFNDTILRKRIANWINEECGASLNCGLKSQLGMDQVVIGHYECDHDRNELRLVAILNESMGLHQSNVLPAHLLGLVLQSREHLLSFLLHSEILAATVHRRLKGTPLSEAVTSSTALLAAVVLAAFLFLILLLVYFSQIYVNWARIVKGEWHHKEYRKVPRVQYSSDKIIVNGQIRTRMI
ncbi:unnamed protein product [Cylicocyclus nassatus]|uniref:Uncharacterized protein n=1 Tax=Cylicocyclus nassatus TaxID=53992 RepID=A0AA36M4S0_CYLNA|nr:unnamed protein product [Cylicocyclus nassatus]